MSDSDSSISDKAGQLEMLVRWEGTDDNGAHRHDLRTRTKRGGA